MDAMKKQASNPLVVLIIGLVIGAIFGLVVLGWWLWPVQWTDATPAQLSAEWQEEYLRMAIQAYGYNPDPDQAILRYEALGENANQVMAEIVQNPEGLDQALITSFVTIVTAPGGQPPTTETQVGTPVQPTAQPGEGEPAPGWLLPALCVVLLLVGAAAAVVFLMRGRKGPAGDGAAMTPAMEAQKAAREAPRTDYTAISESPPLGQFMASYKSGDDLFDDSFSIDSPAGEFLGECGVGISDTIGVGEPKKVTAFEVWLFDKNDIQTVTKVLMSSHAFMDDATRQRLEAKGEPVKVAPGSEAVLETQTLRMSARVVDMSYGEGVLPPESYFDRIILELAIWQKPA